MNLEVSKPETLLKRNSSIDIFRRVLCNFSKNLCYRTPRDDCSCWFLPSNQGFANWSQFFRFFLHFFSFTIDNCNYRSLYRKGIKMKICVFFTMIYPKINMNVVKTICLGNNLLPHIEKKQISPSISLGNCQMFRQISKAVFPLTMQ